MIRIGVAGWDYPDWSGVVYPARVGRGFDRLLWIGRYVDAVEINSTFYRPASTRVASSWARRGASIPGFRFTAKSHRSWTHDPDPPIDRVVKSTLDGLTPLKEAGCLGALLVQFPQSARQTPSLRDRVARLVEAAHGWPLAFEFRHASWDEDRAAAWLRGLGAGWCVVDQPRIAGVASATARVTGPIGYLRLHGRRASTWFQQNAGRDVRYDYLYGWDELEPLATTVGGMAKQAPEIYVIHNNHFRGQALANALQMKYLVQGSTPVAPPELLDAFPTLVPRVRAEPGRLL